MSELSSGENRRTSMTVARKHHKARKKAVSAPPEFTNDLPGRLSALAAEFSQSEIARRTGIRQSTFWKYLNGTMPPLDFGSSLVHRLGVNPAWLLTGEGAKYLSDITAEAEEKAGNLLEIVQAMNAVARKRLGALLGQSHQVKLRELSHALADYAESRELLSRLSRPLFTQLLAELRAALDKRKMDRADTLRQAIEQVEPLCTDEELALKLDEVRTAHEFLRHNVTVASRFQRRVMLRALMKEDGISEEFCEEAYNSAVIFFYQRRIHEALRICRVAQALATEKARTWKSFQGLKVLEGLFLIDLGRLRDGMAIVLDAYPQTDGAYRANVAGLVSYAQLLGGMLDYGSACAQEHPIANHVPFLLRYAAWTENEEIMRLALERLVASNPEEAPANDLDAGFLRMMLGLQREKARKKDVLTYIRNISQHTAGQIEPMLSSFVIVALKASMYRLCGMKIDFAQATEDADRCLLALNPEITPGVITLAIHYRNLLYLTQDKRDDPRRQRAGAFFRSYREGGYACFAEWATSSD